MVARDRLSSAYFEPSRVPAIVAEYAGQPDTLGVGSPGKVGLLDLAFARIGERTELTEHYQKSPLQVMRPLYIDPVRPGTAVLYLMSTGGGILQSDRLRTDIRVGDDACVLVTTQAATKLHRMDADYASQVVNISVGASAVLEYLPDSTIAFAGSRFYQRTVVTADPTATLILGDCFVSGRLARGERHDYDVYASDLEIRNPALAFTDRIRLQPGSAAGPGRFGPATVMASLYVVGAIEPSDLPAAADGVHVGLSSLPGEIGVWMRILGEDPVAVSAAFRNAYDVARRVVLGAPAPDLRKP